MTSVMLQQQIGYLLGMIDALQKENESLTAELDDLEEAEMDASYLTEKWRTLFSACLASIEQDSIDGDVIVDYLTAIKSKITNRIKRIEERIQANHSHIQQHQTEISELRSVLLDWEGKIFDTTN